MWFRLMSKFMQLCIIVQNFYAVILTSLIRCINVFTNLLLVLDHCPAANGNITIGTPVTYKFRNIQAMWLKDPLPVSEEAKTKIYETRSYAATNQYLFSFENLDDYERTDFLTK